LEIYEALNTYLLTRTGLTALIDTRISPDDAPQTEQKPYVVYTNIDNIIDHTHDGQCELEHPNYQWTVYADTKLAASAVARQIKTALKNYSGTLSGIVVQRIKLINDMHQKFRNEDGTFVAFTHYLEYEINYENT
jgi:hypothetical protein